MSKPLTHRERARFALKSIGDGVNPPARVHVDAISRETFPEELVEAARGLVDRLDEIMEHPSYQNVFSMAAVRGNPYSGPSWEQPLSELRTALALYPNQEEPDHE